ncbi:peptide ABC transporter ATP-binding protein [Aurantivibrio infirmus]
MSTPNNIVTADKATNDSAMIEAKDLHKTYQVSGDTMFQKAQVRALSGASFSLQKGKTLAVVGESGCGKSTLARLLTSIEKPTSGSLTINGLDIAGVKTKEEKIALRQMVQIVFQDPYGSLNPRQKIGSILAEPLIINTNMDNQQRRKAVNEMLERVGLRPEHYDRYPHMFSGGQRQRIAIARALMLKPKVVVLDEPVSALDVSIQAQVLNLLADLREELQLTYVFISHDLSVVRFIADDLLVMYLGRPVEYGNCQEIFANPQHPYTQVLLSARPIADPEKRSSDKKHLSKLKGELPSPLSPPTGCLFHPRCPLANDRCANETPIIQEMKIQNLKNEPTRKIACHAIEEGRDNLI